MVTSDILVPLNHRVPVSQPETIPSPHEISRRVSHIRRSWTPAEKVRRRVVGRHRLANLVEALGIDAEVA